MTRARHLTAVLLAAGVGAAFFVAPASGGPTAGKAAKVKTVGVYDDYFAPADLKIGKNTSVRWVWDQFNGESHNVRLAKHPAGVKPKQFKSGTGTFGIKFKRKFTVKGTYKFYCSLHKDVMRMTVKVGK